MPAWHISHLLGALERYTPSIKATQASAFNGKSAPSHTVRNKTFTYVKLETWQS